MTAPSTRLRPGNAAPESPDGRYVLYWMTAQRRPHGNFALDHACALAARFDRPLVVFEPLRAGYRWASDRFHQFVIDGMRANASYFEDTGATYLPYLEPEPGAGSGMLDALAADACAVVADDAPVFFLDRMVTSAAARLSVRVDLVEGCGLMPLSVPERTFSSAYHYRRFVQRNLLDHLVVAPSDDPAIPEADPVDLSAVTRRWTPVELSEPVDLASYPIDHEVQPVEAEGGWRAARARLEAWVADGLGRYDADRNDPDGGATTGLSPYLHFGHIGAHQVFRAVADAEGWNPGRIGERRDGARQGWWGMSESAEAFMDQLCTWRELGFLTARYVPDYRSYESLPDWARATMADHEADPRPWTYDLAAFEEARTHDEIWNAAQRQLVREGLIHNYLRMLWGKKILEWSESPREALRIMVHLNNKYALDGRDPNSYSGIFWTLGRYDRGWPERAVYGKIRSMSSDSTRRKVKLAAYLDTYGEKEQAELGL